MNARTKIVDDFARWTAFSASRSGRDHPKSRSAVYPALKSCDFGRLFELPRSAIDEIEFAGWHQESVEQLATKGFCVGWAAKLINVYLKTRAYVAQEGRPGLDSVIHPPIDSRLLKEIRKAFPRNAAIRDLVHPYFGGERIETIRAIRTYDAYSSIIDGCRRVAGQMQCRLIEVEQLWSP